MDNQTILIVDDEEKNIKLIKAMLMAAKYGSRVRVTIQAATFVS